ncbi:FtsK/SpoIIIE domain-containing protein [Streptomyces sp. NRRL B-24484]|uniref:FtsK/SpoIIIE domain-containing protein n=1 Tax=Streptomyces sp. NRRL B-24484 TaxID=1463833 RepID=UPI0004C14D44|nr:FHA domain-containing protein [Streptomyces sp. NRRL B-24484]
MQIRLTVLRPRSGPAGAGSSTDVLVTAPSGTALGAVAGALAGAAGVRGPRSATHVQLYAGAERVDDQALLGRPPLIDGAVLSLGEPDPDDGPDELPAAAELRVVGGPDAGGVHRLHGEEISVGRSSEADVPLDDPDVSRLHLALHLADGTVSVRDLDSTNGTLLDGRWLRGDSAELPDGGLVRLGESTLQLARPEIGGNSGSRPAVPDGDGHLQVPDRPGARTAAAVPPPPSQAPQVPGGRTRGLLALRRARTAPPQPAPEAAAQHAAARARQAAAQRERWPDPAALLLTALGPGPRLWERTPAHPDVLAVRLGTADRPGGPGTAPGTLLPAVPVTVDLRAAGGLGLTGPRPRLTGLARAVLAQLAVLHPPSGLALVVVAADEQRAADWHWTMWLPHLRPGQGQDCRLLVGFGPEQAEARLAELAAAPGGPEATVLLVDGDPGTPAAREGLDLLLRQGPAAGVLTVCLAESEEELPAGVGARAAVTGEVATRLTVDLPAGGARERIEDVALDAVPAAWAERLARALAPLRESAPAARGPLPDALRLLDLLRLEAVTPAKLSDRWAGLPDGAGAATALVGTARDGLCTVDLADAEALDGPGAEGGPHLLIGGAAGSGKTELLRTLVASLAVAERPERLEITVVESRSPAGRDQSAGLRACTDLPHVTAHLDAAADPRQALLTAEALLDELARREALFGGRDFTAWHTARILRKAPALVTAGGSTGAAAAAARVVEQRTAPDAAAAQRVPARMVVVVDDLDELYAPTSPAGRPLARALAAVAERGGRLGVHLVAATGAPERTAGTEIDEAAQLRIALRTDQPAESDQLIHLPDAAALPEETPGRGYLRRPDGGVTAFQTARVSGRIPRTSTLRPTVVAVDPMQLGLPPTRRPVRELGNGPTDLALLASALQRAAAQG